MERLAVKEKAAVKVYRMVDPVKGPEEIEKPHYHAGVKCLFRFLVIQVQEKRDKSYPGKREQVHSRERQRK